LVNYKNILVATDFSKIAERAAKQANSLATLFRAKLTLLHVVEHFPEDMSESAIPPENMDPKKFFSDQAHDELEKLRSDLVGQHEATLEVIMSSRSAGREITEYATQKGIDLIVVGTHGQQGLLGMLGSTANRITHSATADVLVVRTMD
jgi:universal stress protein A